MRPYFTAFAALLTSTTLVSAEPDAVEICLYEETDWAATLAACNEALAASDTPAEQGRFILHRGIAHEFLGDLDAALLDNVLVGEYRPDWFRGYANAASLAAQQGDEVARLRWAQAAIDAEPENPRAYLEMLVILNNDDAAESCAPMGDQVIELLPDPVDWPFMQAGDPELMGNLG